MKKIILGLTCIVSFGFAENVTFNDIDWVLSQGDKTCYDVNEVGFAKDAKRMLNGQGFRLSGTLEEYNVREYTTDGKSNFWMFPDKDSCERYKKFYYKGL